MANITIQAPIYSNTGFAITAPSSGTYLHEYLNNNSGLAVSIGYGGTGTVLTSMGKLNSNSVWRLRNGTGTGFDGKLSAYGGGFNQDYYLPANSDTFVLSSQLTKTHTLTTSSLRTSKAAGSQIFTYHNDLGDNGAANNNYTLIGRKGADTLTGGSGSDILTGNEGNDTFVFNTTLNGSTNVDTITDFIVANDTIRLEDNLFGNLSVGDLLSDNFYSAAGATGGNDANDRIIYNTTTGDLYYDSDGNGGNGAIKFATLTGSPDDLATTNFKIVDNNQNLSGSNLTGGTGHDTLTGTTGNDTLTGGDGNDSLIGNAEADTLLGGVGADTLLGGDGDDTLTGGNGADLLTGGNGNDTFVFNSPVELLDTITDFNVTDDTINVLASGFGGGLSVGEISASQFLSGAGVTSATDTAHRFIYNTSNGDLYYDIDGTGSTLAAKIATLSANPSLTTADIVVI
jgi:Ca2+-binding RTX toxin-like protein